MSRAPARQTAILLFLAFTASYFALSPGTIVESGYIKEELNSGMQMLTVFNAWVKGRPIPSMMWSRHGPVPVLFDLPFIKLGKLIGSPDLMLSVQPVLLTAGLLTILYLWLRTVCSSGIGLLLTLTGAFCTMLWPYAYIGLETKQSFFVLLAGYLGLAAGKNRTWPRLLFFGAICGLAVSVKSTGIILGPAIAYLIYIQFREDWRLRRAQLCAVCLLAGGIFLISVVTRNFYWTPLGGGALSLSRWTIESSLQLFSNVVGLFGSPTKGLFVFAPILLMSLWAIPRTLRSHRPSAIFALLVTAGMTVFLSTLITTADEVWGPRFMHVAVAPLLVCIGIAWPTFELRKHLPVAVLAGVGLVVSFLGAFYNYGVHLAAGIAAGQNTIEWLTGDRVWNEVVFRSRLLRVWLSDGQDPVFWIPEHVWVWTPPEGAPMWRLIDLRDYAQPQALLLNDWTAPLGVRDRIVLTVCRLSLVVAIVLLGWVIVKTARESIGTLGGNLVKGGRHVLWATVAGLLATVVTIVAMPVHVSAPPGSPELVLSKSEVVAGNDSYVLQIKAMPNEVVWICYSIDEQPPEVFSATLDSTGEVRFEVGADTRKGKYRFLAFSRKNSLHWMSSKGSITVR